MGTQLGTILEYVLETVRWLGMILIAIVGIGLLISEGAKSKLSPSKILMVAGSAILAAVLLWILPTMINYARVDANNVVPDHPVGSYR